MTDHQPVSTVTSPPPVLASYDEAMDAARSLGPRLRMRIPEAEKLRRLPDDTVTDLLESGLCGVMQPRRFGGSELGAETLIDVSVELASQCASTGWVYMLWAAHMWLLALWPAAAQEEMFADPAHGGLVGRQHSRRRRARRRGLPLDREGASSPAASTTATG